MKHKFQRILSVVLCVCMMLSYLPSISVAEAAEGLASDQKGIVTEKSVDDLPEGARELGEANGITAYLIPNRGPAFVHEHTLNSSNIMVTKTASITQAGTIKVSCSKCDSKLEMTIPQLTEDYITWYPKTAEYNEEEQEVTYSVKDGEFTVSDNSFGDYTCEWTDWGNFLPAGSSNNRTQYSGTLPYTDVGEYVLPFEANETRKLFSTNGMEEFWTFEITPASTTISTPPTDSFEEDVNAFYWTSSADIITKLSKNVTYVDKKGQTKQMVCKNGNLFRTSWDGTTLSAGTKIASIPGPGVYIARFETPGSNFSFIFSGETKQYVDVPVLVYPNALSPIYVKDEVSTVDTIPAGLHGWDFDVGIPEDVSTDKAGTYAATITPKYNGNILNFPGTLDLEVSKRTILSVTNPPDVFVTVGTEIQDISFPSSVTIQAQARNGTKEYQSILVSWNIDGYSPGSSQDFEVWGNLSFDSIDNNLSEEIENNPANPIQAKFVIRKNTLREPSTFTWDSKVVTYTGSAVSHEITSSIEGVKQITYNYSGTDSDGIKYNSSNPPSNVGTYTVTATFEMEEGYSQIPPASVTLYIQRLSTADVPNAPQAKTIEKYSVTLENQDANGRTAEYAILENGTPQWQDSPEFTNLTSETAYSFLTRYKESLDQAASAPSSESTFTTLPELYTIQFWADFGSENGGYGEYVKQQAPLNKDYTLAASIFKRTGYSFTGWAINSKSLTPEYSEAQTITEPLSPQPDQTINLYSSWKLKNPSLEIAADKTNVTYGTPITLTATATHEADVDFSYQWYRGDGTPVRDAIHDTLVLNNVKDSGIYYCIVTANDGVDTTTASSQNVNITIKKITPDFTGANTPHGAAIVYGTPLNGSSITSPLDIPGTWTWGNGDVVPAVSDSNTTKYEAIFTPANQDNYNPTTTEVTVEVTPAPLTVKANDATISYGETPIHNGVEITGLVNGDTEGVLQGQLKYDFDYGPNAAVPEDGTATITPSGLTSPNYNITFEPGVLTVKKLVAVITPNQDVNKEYGDDDPDFTYTVSGLINGDQLTGELGREPGEKVGTYKYTLGTLENRNYELVLDETASKFEILPFSSQVRWEGQDETYKTDGTDQSGKITAFFVNENGRKISLTITFRRNGRITPFNAAGTYTVTATYPDNDGTYQLTNDSLEITMGGLTDPTTKLITFPTASPIEYGQKLSDSTLTGGSGGTNGGGTYQWAMPDEMPTTGRHTYDVIFTPADDDFTDYSGEEGWDAGTGTIIRSISITVNPKSAADTSKLQIQTEKTYDGTNTAAVLGGSAIDIAEGDDVTVKVSATYNSATAGEKKTITVRITLSGKDAPKYKAPAAYTLEGKINKADLTLQAADSTIQFGSNIAGKGVIGNGFVNGETVGRLRGSLRYQSATYTKDSPVGTYPLTPYGLTSDNYNITFEDGSLIVEPRKITIKPSTGQNKTEGAVDPTLRYVVSSGSLVASCPLTGSLEREPGETVGIYEILQGTLTNEQNPNYNITFVEGVTFRINNANGSSGYDPVERGEIPDPVLLRKTQTSITIQVVTGAEYSIDGGQTWQRNNTFSNLTPDTTYEIIQRWRADGDEPAGEPSNPLPVRTNDSGISEEDRLPAPTLLNKTARTVTLVPVDGAHYSKDGGKTWQNSNVFSGLRPDTEYQFVQRKKPTSSITYPTSEVLSVTTDAIVEDPSVDPDAPKLPAPTLQEKTSRSVTLVPVDNAQYSKDGGKTWQNSNVFSGLRPGTAYEFVQRLKATPEIAVYPTSEALTVVTDTESSENPENPDIITLPAPKLANKTSRTITLEPTEGAHYSKDGGKTWQNSNVFSGLRPATEYQMVQRIKPTSTLTHPTSEVLLVKTDALVEEPGVDPEAPKLDAPVLQAKTSRSITLVPVDNAQYSKDAGKTWQYSNEFTGLRPGTAYEFVQRLRATPEVPVYPTSDSTVIITDTETSENPENPNPITLPAPKLANKTSRTITLELVDGAHYSKDGGKTWQNSNVFIGLRPDTEYQMAQRIKPTSTLTHPTSEILLVKTDAIVEEPDVDPEAPKLDAPVLQEKTSRSITLVPVDNAQYSKDAGKTWQYSNVFSGLRPGTAYEFVQRLRATPEIPVYPTSDPTVIITDTESIVDPEQPEPIKLPPPTLASKDSTSVTLNYMENAEYSRDGGRTWQSSNHFIGLQPNTTYQFVQRLKASGSVASHPASEPLSVTTDRASADPDNRVLEAPVMRSRTATTIILHWMEDVEWSRDNGTTWQTTNGFTELTPDTEYTFVQRYKATSTLPAGPTSPGLTARTLKSSGGSSDVTPEEQIPPVPVLLTRTSTSISVQYHSALEYSRDNGATWQESNTFTNLEPDTPYNIIQRYKAAGSQTASKPSDRLLVRTLPEEVTPPAGDIAAPVLYSKTDSQIILMPVEGAEYSIDNGRTWQPAPIFTGLTAATKYTLIQRYQASGSNPAGKNSAPLEVVTDSHTTTDPSQPGNRPIEAPQMTGATRNTITLKKIDGAEYSRDNGATWQDSNVFSGLTANTVYTFVQRYKADSKNPAGDISLPASFKTTSSGSSSSDGNALNIEIDYENETINTKRTHEYSTDNGKKWQATGKDMDISDLMGKTILVREKENGSTPASEPVTIDIPKRPGAPSGLKVNFEREILNTLRGQEFSDDAGKTWDETGRDMSVSDLMGVTLQVRESATDEEFASAAATVRIPARPKAPTVKYTDASGQNMSDGSLSGTNDRMEYSRDGGSTWINITGNTVTNLAPGAYQIRTKATQSAFSSEPAYVQIGTSGQSGTSNPGSNTGSNNGNNGNTGDTGSTTIPTNPGGTTTTKPSGTGGNNGNGSTTGTIQNTPGSSGGTISTGNRPSGTTTTLPSTTKKPETATGTSGSTTQTPNKTQPSGTANQGSKPGTTSSQSPSSTVGIAGANVPLASPANANWVFTPGSCPSDYYKDVYQQLWYHDAIDFTVLNRFMIGISADEWAPDLKMTNAMVAQVFYRVVGTNAKETTNKYTDVKQGAWYYDAVAWATNNGIMKNSTTTFGINDEITYEELATVFYNLCNTYGLTMVNGSIPTTVTTPATTTEGQTALTALVNTGIFNVNGNTSISASGSMTRATFAQVLTNFCTSFNSQISANSQIQGATQGIYTNPGVTTTAGVACT